MKSVLVIHGPNLNMLGVREPAVYGTLTLDDINQKLHELAQQLGIMIECFQSNVEGEIINKIHSALDTQQGIIINAGAFTHYSYAITDALKAVNLPTIEVHLSNIHSREDFRKVSVISPVVKGIICGLGEESYLLALQAISKIV